MVINLGIDSRLLPKHVQAQLLGQQKAAIAVKAGYVRPRYPSPVSDGPINASVWLSMRLVNELNGSRENVHVVAKRRREHRKAAGVGVSLAPGFARSSSPDMRYVVTLTRIIGPRGKEFDADDNLRAAFKSAKDGVADALEIDDRSKRIEWRYGQERGKDWRVRIEIESVK